MPAAPISMSERFWAKVEKTDTCWNWTASKMSKGYGQFRTTNGGMAGAHRVAYEMLVGPVADGMVVDHLCYNKGCVNPEHLRVVTNKQNMENRPGLLRNNQSGFHGVSWATRKSKWQASLTHNGQRIHLGYFESAEDANAAVLAKRLELFTHNDLDRSAA